MVESPRGPMCERHESEPTVAWCEDCGRGLCERCRVDVPDIGVLCWGCAAQRGGLRARRRLRAAPLTAATASEPPLAQPLSAPGGEPVDVVRRFEQRVADRMPHPLISGLSDRLAEAGVDPELAVRGDEVLAEIGRLQAIADSPPLRARRRRR